MNGLTPGEQKKLEEIRELVKKDLTAAKLKAWIWICANRRRYVHRRAACRTVKNLFSHGGSFRDVRELGG